MFTIAADFQTGNHELNGNPASHYILILKFLAGVFKCYQNKKLRRTHGRVPTQLCIRFVISARYD